MPYLLDGRAGDGRSDAFRRFIVAGDLFEAQVTVDRGAAAGDCRVGAEHSGRGDPAGDRDRGVD